MSSFLIGYALGVVSGVGGLAGFALWYSKRLVKSQKWPSL